VNAIEVRGLHYRYADGTVALRDVNFTVAEGERMAVVGPNEVHSFENDSPANFAFVEFWAPPPQETVWLTDDV